MKRVLITLAFAMVALLAQSARGNTNSVAWFKVAAGGGTGTGGAYSLSGTIGQPDAGTMSGGAYGITGGFWSIIFVVQSPEVPRLRIVRTTTNAVMIAWPTSDVAYSLQQNSTAAGGNWTVVTNSIAVVGSENQVVIAPPTGNRFFRLQSP